MSDFDANSRGVLAHELMDEIRDLIGEHAAMATFTTAEIVGMLQMLQFEFLTLQFEDEGDDPTE